MSHDYDLIIIGSGAGAGPIAYELSHAGASVLVLEKGPWLHDSDFFKDELASARRPAYTPQLSNEFHVLEEPDGDSWYREASRDSGWDFWNGNLVGGSSNLMSGFFYRLKPTDFRLLSEYGPIKGANVVDWPISYQQLEPYYAKAEQLIGISGRVKTHPQQEPRSTADFPYPPTAEHPISQWFDKACSTLGYHSLQTPRAILSRPGLDRASCQYSGYCGSYGCASGAKGSSRAALLERAVKTGHCHIQSGSKVYRIETDAKGRATAVHYYDHHGKALSVSAKAVVVACQAIESSRLLLASIGPKHPNGLGNHSGQLGKNLLFSAGGVGRCDLHYADLDKQQAMLLKVMGPFVNRGLQDWYEITSTELGGRAKGGTVDFLFQHPNIMGRAISQKWDDDDTLLWGTQLKHKMHRQLTQSRGFNFEVFNDWLPTDDCYVSLDTHETDRWGDAVARVRLGYHPHDLKVGHYITKQAKTVFQQMGGRNIRTSVSGSPPANLQAGGCRFGHDPATSVLDADCRVHSADNVFVTDGSFMPTGGSVPYTWTIYANAFRVADTIRSQLGV